MKPIFLYVFFFFSFKTYAQTTDPICSSIAKVSRYKFKVAHWCGMSDGSKETESWQRIMTVSEDMAIQVSVSVNSDPTTLDWINKYGFESYFTESNMYKDIGKFVNNGSTKMERLRFLDIRGKKAVEVIIKDSLATINSFRQMNALQYSILYKNVMVVVVYSLYYAPQENTTAPIGDVVFYSTFLNESRKRMVLFEFIK